MKTSIQTLTTICTVIISLSLSAQRNHNGNQPQANNQTASTQNNTSNDNRGGSSNNTNNRGGGNNLGSRVSIHIGGWPNNYNNYPTYGYGYNNYNSYYSIKKASKNSIRQSANIISQALNYSDWNDTYSPWLAKAIRHQQYAKQLYFWGDYAGALNHAERAGFLAWNTLSYFNGSNGNNNYPNPYSDPNNPYYRQTNPNSTTQPNTSSDEDYGYRKGSTEKTQENTDANRREANAENAQKTMKPELDNALPQSKLSDRELLKTKAKDLDIE